MRVFKLARERAEDAQAAFAAFLIARIKNRDEMKILLESVFSTAHAAEWGTCGIVVHANHTRYAERAENKFFFQDLETKMWNLYRAGIAAEVIYGAVRSAGATKQMHFLPYDALIARVHVLEGRPRVSLAH